MEAIFEATVHMSLSSKSRGQSGLKVKKCRHLCKYLLPNELAIFPLRSLIDTEMSKRSQKDLRACLLCSILLPIKDFVDNGCPNCQDLLSNAHDGTTSNFEGNVALLKPAESWVGKWQGLTNYVSGFYAVRYPKCFDVVDVLE